ncbi:hypothetical protein DH2020_018747 [Rehmannia glutinosa]|uniref:Tf2-1-like SH3-like domain-containing protein n=1 Tax=Rehmannia glutinosa TaxID=99300 RepID=A0ABR0WNY0_REHGL
MLRACVLEFKGSWDEYIALMEFAYNNQNHSSIGMAPYEALYGRKCRLKAAQDRQKSYVDQHRREMEYEVGEKVFFRVSPWKGILRFGKKGKLSPCYIGPYEILEKIGPLAYRSNPSHILRDDLVEVADNLTYVEESVRIVGYKEEQLRNRVILLIKVLWNNHSSQEATWET